MDRVLILMSTYKGGAKIKKQVDSILSQTGVATNILIRDDGSDQATLKILRDIKKDNIDRVRVVFASNAGWKKSFHLLLQSEFAHGFDYYGFSDQDDIWMLDKLSTCIKMMEDDSWDGPKLAHCSALTVDENLQMRGEQEHRIAQPLNHKNAFATEYFQGCAMVWNQACMNLIQRHQMKDPNISHDYWVGLIGYLFGKVYFCEDPKFYHIRYGNSESSDGNVKKGRLRRVKSLMTSKDAYMNPSLDLLDGYSDLLNSSDKHFLECMREYKCNFKDKMQIISDEDFRRPSRSATMLMKLAILINKY